MKKLFVLVVLIFFVGCKDKTDDNTFTGIIEGKVYTLSSPVSDKIISLKYDEGYMVNKGDTVAVIDTAEFSLKLSQIESVRKQLLIQIKNSKIQVSQAKDNFDYFSDLYEKNNNLAKNNAIPLQKLKDIRLKLDNAKKQYAMAVQNLNLLKEKLNETSVNKELIMKKLAKSILVAPKKGVVEKIYFEETETPAPVSPIIDIVVLDTVWCYIYVNEKKLPKIKTGQPVRIVADGYNKEFKGWIAHINNLAEFTPKNILTKDNRKALVFGVKIYIPNNEEILKPGMIVEVSL